MQQNNQLTNDRLAQVYRNLKRWAEHDNALNSYISGQKIDPIFHDCVVALAELQERRKADSAEPAISIIYKDGWPEPNSVAPIVGAAKLPDGVHEFYTAPPAPVVPDEIDVNDPVLDTHRKWMAEGWNRCRSSMLHG